MKKKMYFDRKMYSWCKKKNVALWLKYIETRAALFFFLLWWRYQNDQIHELHIEWEDIYIWMCMYVCGYLKCSVRAKFV